MKMVGEALAARRDGAAGAGTPRLAQLEYVVVLTKADKNEGKVKREVLNQVRQAMAFAGCPPDARLVPTSSKSRMGRDELWRQLRGVMLEGAGAG